MNRLAEQRAASKADAENDKYMALTAAGLGMMSGTSPYALSNIGAGGAKGLEQLAQSRKLRAAEESALSKAELSGLRAKETQDYRNMLLAERKNKNLLEAGGKEDKLFDKVAGRINQDPRIKSLEKQREKSMAEPGTEEYEYFDNAIEAIRDAYFKEAGIKNPRVRVKTPKPPAPKAKEPGFLDSIGNFFRPSSGTMKFDAQGNQI
jgi:hypothetical protein